MTRKKYSLDKRVRRIASFLLLFCFISACGEDHDNIDFISIRGVFRCHENSIHSGFRSYLIEIEQVAQQDNQYIILNFHNSGDNDFIYATMHNDTLYIENQLIRNSFVAGKGRVSSDFREIELFYYLDDGKTEAEYYARYFR